MPWILYLHFGFEKAGEQDESRKETVLKGVQKFSQQIEQEEAGCWLELRGPHTVFQVLGELKRTQTVIALAPNKWLAKFLVLTSEYYGAAVKLDSKFYLWRRKIGLHQILWLGPGEKVLPQDFYPSLPSAREAWAAWFESKMWQTLPLSGLWTLDFKTIEKLVRLGFKNLGQLALLGDDFLIRETGNPFLPLFLKGREGLPALEANYPPKSFELFRDLKDRETQSEGDWVRMAETSRELAFQLAEQLAARNEGCLRLRLTVSHTGESFASERQFCSPEQNRLSLAETVLLMAEKFRFESFEEVRLEARDIRPAVHKQYSLFAEAGRETRDPRLAALTLRFPGILKKGISFSRREQMLAYWDPWRVNSFN